MGLDDIAWKLNIFIKFGGLEPSTGVHVPPNATDMNVLAAALSSHLSFGAPPEVKYPRWDLRNAQGVELDGDSINIAGVATTDFDDFKDCTYISFRSGGAGRASSMYIPGRPDIWWEKGQPTALLVSWIDDLVDLLRSYSCTDSEGFAIEGVKRVKPSRRRNMRLAP